MTIHHATQAKATKNGIILKEEGSKIVAHWAERNRAITLDTAKEALSAMVAIKIAMTEYNPMVVVQGPDMWIAAILQDDGEIVLAKGEDLQEVIADGIEAFVEGGYEEEKPEVISSVVPHKYKKLYAEQGRPADCGDWLADVLAEWVSVPTGRKNRTAFLRDQFELILAANEVDCKGKWFKSTNNGLFRMTGRNKLANAVRMAEALTIPSEVTGDADILLTPPAAWLAAGEGL